MTVREITPDEKAHRENRAGRARQLAAQGICPTCRNFETGDIYPPAGPWTFHEDDLAICMLEQYPRNPGHSILLLKAHYEDIADLPPEVGARLFPLIHAMTNALKIVLGAEKVYMCTMCDGLRNHLHLQFLPRLPGDTIRGSGLFVKERRVLAESEPLVARLREEMGKRTGSRQNKGGPDPL